jgi:hypothetical protein
MKLLSSLSTQDKIKLAAELDGYKDCIQSYAPSGFWWGIAPTTGYQVKLPNYQVSYDAIIPLVQKQYPLLSEDMKSLFFTHIISTDDCTGVDFMMASPATLLDALLVVTRRAVL